MKKVIMAGLTIALFAGACSRQRTAPFPYEKPKDHISKEELPQEKTKSNNSYLPLKQKQTI